ncbi:MAG TPA: ADP-ribosyl-(dinitrogen reductase) hydrolase [Burkholderiaceae bacterium]|jgi:hypothetical protein
MLIISPKIKTKIGDPSHGSISEREVMECFLNRCGRVVKDDREEHRTDPPTVWFVSETHLGKKVKVVYVEDDENIYLKSAYVATKAIQDIFEIHGN